MPEQLTQTELMERLDIVRSIDRAAMVGRISQNMRLEILNNLFEAVPGERGIGFSAPMGNGDSITPPPTHRVSRYR